MSKKIARQSMRDLRSGNLAGSTSLVQPEDEGIKKVNTREELYKLLDVQTKIAIEQKSGLSLLKIHYKLIGGIDDISTTRIDQQSINTAIETRLNQIDLNLTYTIETQNNSITGYITDKDDKQSSEKQIGQVVNELQKPLQLDGCWYWLEILAGCVILEDLEEKNTRSFIDAAELTVAETTHAMHILLYNPYLNRRAEREKDLKEKITSQMRNEQIEVSLEPIAETKTQKIGARQAITRLANQDDDPDHIFDCAFKNGQIYELGEISRKLATNQFIKQMRNSEEDIETIWLKTAISELANPNFIKSISELVIPANFLGILITDNQNIDAKPVLNVIEEMKLLGVKIGLDEVNETSRNLTKLNKLPIDLIQIDPDLMKNSAIDEESRTKLETIILICQLSNTKTQAPRISTIEEMKVADQIGIDYVQGPLVTGKETQNG